MTRQLEVPSAERVDVEETDPPRQPHLSALEFL
jgi:hypothetical protein